jgi:plasmid stabilization system protein ParE
MRRFHFAIFFRIIEERAEVVIAGVFHQRQDPALWPER